MAERRMLTKKITDDDRFMNLSSSAQALYLHLNMSADDDGFCNQVSTAMFKAHASVQDLEALLSARYLLQFDSGVIVIKHWRMANALRKDRYTPTAFKEEFAKLKIKKNGAYTMNDLEEPALEGGEFPDGKSDETARQAAYRESNLPYSFDYKIRRAFLGKPCPICGFKMQAHVDECGISTNNRLPTIQHNLPISKGGKHELGNISVICHQCNIEIQDRQTGSLNADEVIEEWEKLSGCRLVATCLPQDRIGKDRIGKDRIGKDRLGKDRLGQENSVYTRAREDGDDGFEDFWNAYPKKTGDIKQAYFEYVGALEHGATLGDMLSALEWQKQQPEWTGERARFIPSAEKWLRNRGWTAEKPRGAETGNIFLQMMEDGTT